MNVENVYVSEAKFLGDMQDLPVIRPSYFSFYALSISFFLSSDAQRIPAFFFSNP